MKNKELTETQVVAGLISQAVLHALGGQAKRAGQALIEASEHDKETFNRMFDMIAVAAGEDSAFDDEDGTNLAAPMNADTEDSGDAELQAGSKTGHRGYFNIVGGAGKQCASSAEYDGDDEGDEDEDEDDVTVEVDAAPVSIAACAARIQNAVW